MKKSYIFLFLWTMSTVACSDWLDVLPKTSIPEKDLYENEYGFKDVLTGIYLKMGTTSLYGKELTFGYMDMLAGRYNSAPDVYDWKTVYNYDGSYKSVKNTFYTDIYNIIANINNFLHYLDEKREVIKTPLYYETMKGEALGLRAFLHFDLLRMFGPVFSQEPGGGAIPYRLRLDNIATPVLKASEVVEHCLTDLHAADSLLEKYDTKCFKQDKAVDPFLRLRQFRMNTWAVKAMLARVYCYRGDEEGKTKASKYATEVLEAGTFPLAESNNKDPMLIGEHIFSLHIYEMKKVVDEVFINVDFTRILGVDPSWLTTIYETTRGGASDFRVNRMEFEKRKDPDGSREKSVLLKYSQNAYHGKYNSVSGVYGGAEQMPLIRIPEMYYILAECDPDKQNSAYYLDKVRLARAIPAGNSIGGNEVLMGGYDGLDIREDYDQEHTVRINEIMKEYQKEYYGEGQLFYFYKRHNYRTFLLCPLGNVRDKYKFPIHENEIIFGKKGEIQ